jgi:DNA-binding SARP family transcriptional activator/tetratricopeptide (TPR) repeat protein
MGVSFRLFGPVAAERDGRRLDLGYPKQRHVLAALLVRPNRVVSADELIDRVWGEHASDGVRAALHSYLSRLRRTLADAGVELTREHGGYAVAVPESDVDIHRFRSLVAEARSAADDELVAKTLDDALALWHGVPLAGIDTLWAVAERAVLLDERHAARLDRADALLRLGRHTALLGELSSDAEAHPLDERLACQYLLALHRSGRTADALAHYHRLATRMSDELGSSPSPELRDLHQRILRADPALLAPETVSVRATPVPRQLPPAPRRFTGRAPELARLDELAGRDTGLVVVVAGPGGVGKTWFELHWAHRGIDRFPDGQQYVNLRGFDAADPVSPSAAVRGFLDALGVLPGAVPDGLDAQVGLYRSLVSDRRLLVVLDNAADTAQVTPLLPGSPAATVLVTSRGPLPGLVATQGAHPVLLGLLRDDEATAVLAEHLGPERPAKEPEAAAELVRACAGLPLALGILAARAATRPDFPLSAFADELRDQPAPLDVLDLGAAELSLRTVFSWSYRTLGERAARLFRLLGIHPGPDVSRDAMASLLGVPVAEIRPVLAELTGGYLLTERAPGRYVLHDLVRAYACELSWSVDTEDDRLVAVRRLLDHYLHTAHAAASRFFPHRHPIDLEPPAPGTVTTALTGYEEALDWFRAEHELLRSAVTDAARAGFPVHAWQLAWTTVDFLSRQGHWEDLHHTQRAALSATEATGDRIGQAHAHRSLGRVHARLGPREAAHEHYDRALELFTELGDLAGQARTHHGLSVLHDIEDRQAEALGHSTRAAELYREVGNHVGLALALNGIGWSHAHLGEYDEALRHCEEALALQQVHGHEHGQAATWDSLGYVHQGLGNHARSIDCYQRAIDLYRGTGDRDAEAESLDGQADTHLAAGDRDAALAGWRLALAIREDLRDPNADRIRAKIDKVDSRG